MRKPLIKTLLSVLLLAVALVGSTVAYLTAADTPATNTFRLAQVSTEIEETGNTSKNKLAVVENTGKSPVYVRAKVLISSGDASVKEDMFKFTYGSDWEEGEDGFYYYKQVLPGVGEDGKILETTPLFTGIEVDGNVPSTAVFSVDVYQESVLAPGGESYTLERAQAAFRAKG